MIFNLFMACLLLAFTLFYLYTKFYYKTTIIENKPSSPKPTNKYNPLPVEYRIPDTINGTPRTGPLTRHNLLKNTMIKFWKHTEIFFMSGGTIEIMLSNRNIDESSIILLVDNNFTNDFKFVNDTIILNKPLERYTNIVVSYSTKPIIEMIKLEELKETPKFEVIEF